MSDPCRSRGPRKSLSRLGIALALSALAVSQCIPKDQAVSADAFGAGGSAPPPAGGNLLKASQFDDGRSLPWMSSFTLPGKGAAQVERGAYCVAVQNRGANPWDAQVRHRQMTIQKGHTYSVQFKAFASRPTRIRPKVGMSGPPYKEYWSQTLDLTPSPQVFTATFKMHDPDDPTAELAFHVGGGLALNDQALSVCLDDVYLTDPEFIPPPEEKPDPIPVVRVNQVGYLPKLPKFATLGIASLEPVTFQLVDSAGAVRFEGTSSVFGKDIASGDAVHWAEFSKVSTPGKGYVLKMAAAESHPFDIGTDIYTELKYDALAYFYHNRSGIPIEMPYAKKQEWTRPAGHLGDRKIACAPGTGCSYSLDVSGGWYDAGDHGKYVVNGGISVWTLLNQYERAQAFGTRAQDFADGKLAIPENSNGVPDLLDEARWEVEFLLKMQVPEGQPKAGMAHHKMHDHEWTALGVAPHQAEKQTTRYLRPPSTAATLNLAATAAQCARIFKRYDAAFAKKCLLAAERAWSAAEKYPKILAPKQDEMGGGAYDDTDVSDEFYWAAAELFATTAKQQYRQFLTQSPHHRSKTLGGRAYGGRTAMTWRDTAALGAITLSVVPNTLGKADVSALRERVIATADAYQEVIAHQGYRVPLDARGGYPWGSNSLVLNNMIVLALAADFTNKAAYVAAVADGMNYLLGQNPLAQSYVTGYGEKPLANPHHRFWAHQADDQMPAPPPGAVSGGPNSSLQDPYAQAAGLAGCAAQKCFIDHIESWSTNEITINWNAPLAWVTAFLDEKAN